MVKQSVARVVVEVYPREVRLHLFGSHSESVETERFAMLPDAPNISPADVGRDVFNLLYQCALDATVDE